MRRGLASKRASAQVELGQGSAGCSYAYDASESRPPISPTAAIQRRTAGSPGALAPGLDGEGQCTPHMLASAKGEKNWLRRESSRSTQTRSLRTAPRGPATRRRPRSARSRSRSGLPGGSRSNRCEHRGQQLEVRPVHRPPPGRRPARARAAASRPRPWTDQGAASARSGGAQPTAHEATIGQGQRGHAGRAEAQPHARRAPAPAAARVVRAVGADRRRHVLAEDGEILPQVETRRQGLDRGLSRAYRLGLRGRQQPGGERGLAHARPRLAEQLVQRAFTEQIEIAGVRMVRIREARSRAPGPRPPAVEARGSPPVERGAALRPEGADRREACRWTDEQRPRTPPPAPRATTARGGPRRRPATRSGRP